MLMCPESNLSKADLSLMRDAQHIGKELPAETLDLLILTTGIMATRKREVTSEGGRSRFIAMALACMIAGSGALSPDALLMR